LPIREQPTTAASALTNLLSPAQDDASILDPNRSPIPDSTSTSTLVLDVQVKKVVTPKKRDSPVARRKQSLSELKQAYTRMRDISGVDVSQPTSRSTSDDHLGTGDIGQAIQPRPSVDLVALDAGLKASMLDTSHESTMTITDKIGAGIPSDISSSTGTSLPSSDSIASTVITAGSIHTEMSQAQSGRSWHTAKEEHPPQSHRSTLPRSRSKSTHDLFTLALLDQVEEQQGKGWWSTDKPRSLNRRASDLEQVIKQRRLSETDEAEDLRLAQLERIAKSSTLPHRDRFADPESPSPTAATPTQSYRYRELPPLPTEVRQPRPTSSFVDVRPKGLRISALPPRMSIDGESPWRPSSVQPNRQRPYVHGPRTSLVAGGTWRYPESDIIIRRRGSGATNAGSTPYPDDETPTRPRLSHVQSNTGTSRLTSGSLFATSKISPDIARRASWITKRSEGEGEKQGQSRQPVKKMVEEEVEKKMEAVKEKYQLELDVLLGALKAAKDECAGLKNEVEGLKRVVGDGGERLEEEDYGVLCYLIRGLR
jgi:hypothetical protein